MNYEKTITFPDPPMFYEYVRKNKVEVLVNKKTGKKTVRKKTTRHYLTANIFYAGDTHFSLRSKIVNYAKNYLMVFCSELPKLEKCQVEIIYYHPDAMFDIDNKGYFWLKCFMDLLKTPTSKELVKAKKYGNFIKSMNVLDDDNTKHFDRFSVQYQKGAHKMDIKITGRLKNLQKSLF